MNGTVEVVHLNLLGRPGRELAGKYRVAVTPATLVFDQQGELLDRQIGMPDTGRLREKIDRGG